MDAIVPLRWIGPVKINARPFSGECMIPLATFEKPLWNSTMRGAKACTLAGGISVSLTEEGMTRSLLVESPTAAQSAEIAREIESRFSEIADVAEQTSRYAKLKQVHIEQAGNLLYIRLAFATGDASGHNMATIAAERSLDWMLREYPALQYVSLSANYCTDKKTSAINGILGRGRRAVADVLLPRKIVAKVLKSTPEKIVNLQVKKNLLGSILAGSLRSANAHFANMLLGFYLATGQDAANIVEGSQGVVHAECRGDELYFSVTLPNLIVGSVGSGKSLPFAQENLRRLGCLEERPAGENGDRLAAIAAAAVLAGELSLLAALTNPHELVEAHQRLEREVQHV